MTTRTAANEGTNGHMPGVAPARLVVETPIGPLLVTSGQAAITEVLLPNTGAAAAGSSPGSTPEVLRAAALELDEYFSGSRQRFTVPLAAKGTPFQVAVWNALDDIPYGQTVSYKELAASVGRPGAFRAVGQANGANPLPIFHPCHRVVAAGGHLGGYGGGLEVKRQLLALEGSPLAAAR
jgi:methylated-DNA-[protein]-cysteine S-methyltransferase